MKTQKHLFSLKNGIHYFNNAYKAPLLKTAEEACIKALIRERNPSDISQNDFFTEAEEVRMLFGKLIHAPAQNIAIVPSTSYGFGSALNNIKAKEGGHAITVQNEFPSGYMSLKRWCKEQNNEFIVVKPVTDSVPFGEGWHKNILKQINEKTSVVLVSSVHWMNCLKFDLERIGQKCKEVGAKLIVDGTQSVGALPIDVEQFNIDVLICASYKWLLGPYSIVLAYFNNSFEQGKPLEEVWMNRVNAQDFSSLNSYEEQFEPKSKRFNVGETSNFILMPIIKESLRQILEWQPHNIQNYSKDLIQPLLHFLKEVGIKVEAEKYFSNHLFSIKLPPSVDKDKLNKQFSSNGIILSGRGDYLRISIHVFNTEEDVRKLIAVIKMFLA